MTAYIRVNSLYKGYKQYNTPYQRLIEWISLGKIRLNSFRWVLKNLNFEINNGESVGIIGKNGVGKSTLLKLITGTTKPTTGNIDIKGRVAALLELGLGFHPNFTGKENIFIAGQLLGFNAQEIRDHLHEIEAFSELGDYINQPIRVYSTGMLVRLGFSIATAIRPDVLIVDEALSVGDVYFQQKCYERIAEFKKQGTVILFVSHDLIAVNNICDRALYLSDGNIVYDGKPDKAIDFYHKDYLKIVPKTAQMEDNLIDHQWDDADHTKVETINSSFAKLINVEFLSNNVPVASVTSDSIITLSIRLHFLKAFKDPHVGFKIRDRLGIVIFETNSYCMRQTIGSVNQNEIITVNFTFKIGLIPGEYSITVGVANDGYGETEFREPLIYIHSATKITVLRNLDTILWTGIYNILPEFSCIKMFENNKTV